MQTVIKLKLLRCKKSICTSHPDWKHIYPKQLHNKQWLLHLLFNTVFKKVCLSLLGDFSYFIFYFILAMYSIDEKMPVSTQKIILDRNIQMLMHSIFMFRVVVVWVLWASSKINSYTSRLKSHIIELPSQCKK